MARTRRQIARYTRCARSAREILRTKAAKLIAGENFGSNGENFGAQKIGAANQKGEILAWGSLSDYHPREGYRITAKISVYAAPEAHGKGLGGRLVNFMLERAPEFGIKNIVALIFSSNTASLNLFAKFGFTRWGKLPEVCDMCGKPESLTIPGKNLN